MLFLSERQKFQLSGPAVTIFIHALEPGSLSIVHGNPAGAVACSLAFAQGATEPHSHILLDTQGVVVVVNQGEHLLMTHGGLINTDRAVIIQIRDSELDHPLLFSTAGGLL